MIDFIKKNYFWLTIILLFLFSFGLRYYYVNYGLFHYDSVVLAQQLEKSYNQRTLLYYYEGYGSIFLDALFYFPYRFFTGVYSAEQPVLFAGILFGSLSVIFMFLFVHAWFKDYSLALWSSIFLSVTPIYLSVTTFGKEHSHELTFMALSLWLMVLFFENNNKWLLYLSVLSALTTVFIRTPNFLFLLSYLVYFLVLDYSRNKHEHYIIDFLARYKEVILTSFVIIVIFLALHPDVFSRAQDKDLRLVPRIDLILNSLALLSTALGSIIVSVAAVIGIICFLIQDRRKLIPLSVNFLIYFLFYGVILTIDVRMFTPMLIPLMIFVAKGAGFANKLDERKIASTIFALLIVWLMFSYIKPTLEFRKETGGFKSFGEYVGKVTESNAILIVQDEPITAYYANRTTIGLVIGNKNESGKQAEYIEGLIKNGTPVYMMTNSILADIKFNNAALENKFKFNKIGDKLSDNFIYSTESIKQIQELHKLELKTE